MAVNPPTVAAIAAVPSRNTSDHAAILPICRPDFWLMIAQTIDTKISGTTIIFSRRT